jgi:hypothetical protein
MKPLILTLLLLELVASTPTSHAATSNDIVRIAYHIDIPADPSPPFRWLECNDTKQSTGSIRHLHETVFRDLNKTIEWVSGDTTPGSNKAKTDEKYQQLQKNDFDFLVTRHVEGHSYNTVSARLVTQRTSLITDISHPIFNGDITSLASYSGGVRYSASLSNAIYAYLTTHKLPIKTYTSNRDALTSLINNDIDYVITEYFIGKEWAYNHKVTDQLVFHDIDIEGPSIYLLASKYGNASNLITEINNKLQELHNNGFFERLNQYYLSQWLSQPCVPPL